MKKPQQQEVRLLRAADDVRAGVPDDDLDLVRNPLNVVVRESLRRVLGKLAQGWGADEVDTLGRWLDEEKPTFENLWESFLAGKTWEEFATLFPEGFDALGKLQKRHAAALATFAPGVLDDALKKMGFSWAKELADENEMGFSGGAAAYNPGCFVVLPDPVGIGGVGERDSVARTLRTDGAWTVGRMAGEGDGRWEFTPAKDVFPQPPPASNALDRLRWNIARGAVVLVSPNIFPTESWLDVLAYGWLAERRNRARALTIETRPIAVVKGLHFTVFPRGMEAASAMGGPIRVADPVEVNGETYALEPDMATKAAAGTLAVVPRGADVVPAEWLENPAQLTLGLDMGNHAALREYLIETATKTTALADFSNMCPKLLGFMFAAAPMSGRGVKGTLADLAGWLYPDLKERRQPKDFATVGNAFVAMKSLRLLDRKPNGVYHPYDLFVIDYDLSNKREAEVGWCINPWLAERMQGGAGGGFFLLNMSRWLALPTQNPRLFPLAMRLAAYMDKARDKGIYNPNRLLPVNADQLAWECNTLPEGAAMYRTGKTDAEAAKVQLKRARANLEHDLDELQDKGLLGKWKKEKVHGKGFWVLPVPPDDYAEACAEASRTVKDTKRKKAADKGKG